MTKAPFLHIHADSNYRFHIAMGDRTADIHWLNKDWHIAFGDSKDETFLCRADAGPNTTWQRALTTAFAAITNRGEVK